MREMPDNWRIVDVIYMCMHLHVAALPWYNICIVLQIDQCRYFITVLTIFTRYKAEIKDKWHIVDAIYTCTSSSLVIDHTDINFIDI